VILRISNVNLFHFFVVVAFINLKGKQIEINTEMDLNVWCLILDCEKKDLIDAIQIVGCKATSVKNYLSQKRKKTNCDET
jgi:hypothetical protein